MIWLSKRKKKGLRGSQPLAPEAFKLFGEIDRRGNKVDVVRRGANPPSFRSFLPENLCLSIRHEYQNVRSNVEGERARRFKALIVSLSLFETCDMKKSKTCVVTV